MLKIDSIPEFDQLHPSIQNALCTIPENRHYFIALSGGLDSMALLYFVLSYLVMRSIQSNRAPANIRVLHVHHGLSVHADEWVHHCRRECERLGLSCHVEYVTVHPKNQGIEAAARKARYRVFESYLKDGGVLLQGHHQNDQAETVLMRLLRGAGPEGLSGIPQQRMLSGGELYRPWLDLPRVLLEAEVSRFSINWVEDDSNAELHYDRNFLRHQILPLIEKRWPNVLDSFSRTAERAGQVQQHLEAWCADQITSVLSERHARYQAVDLKCLSQYSYQQQCLLLRYWLGSLKTEHPSDKIFERIWTELIPAKKDALPALRWGDNHLRRFDNCLFYLDEKDAHECVYSFTISAEPDDYPCFISAGRYQFKLEYLDCYTDESRQKTDENVLAFRAPAPQETFTIRSRIGGETIVSSGSSHHKPLKKLFQEQQIPPWERAQLPMFFYGSSLVLLVNNAVEDCVLADGFEAKSNSAAIILSW